MGTTEQAPSVTALDLRDYLRILKRRWLLVTIAGLVGIAAAAVPVALMTPKYEARTQLYVSVRSLAGGTGELAQGNSFAKEVVSSYTDVVGTSVVLEPVISDLGLDTTVAELRKDVKASSPDGSVLIDITVTDADPKQAELIAEAISRSLTEAVQNQLEPQTADGQSLIGLTTTQKAQAEDEPVSPRAVLLLPAGLLLGLLCGVGAAVVTAVLDTRVRSAHDIGQLTSAPVIGRIPRESSIVQDPLVVLASKHGAAAESFRALRTNVDYLAVGSKARVFVITSPSLGEGKSITAVNLSIILAESGQRVALVDCDLRRPKIDEYLGIEGAAGLSDVLVGRVEIADVLQPWGDHSLCALPAGHIPPNPSELLGSPAMDTLLNDLRHDFDYVVLDAPPTLPVTDSAVVGTRAGGVIMVAAAGRTKKSALDESIRTHQALGTRVAGVVITMLPSNGDDPYTYGKAAAYAQPSTGAGSHAAGENLPEVSPVVADHVTSPAVWPILPCSEHEDAAVTAPDSEDPPPGTPKVSADA